ncbi:MAG: type II secretion system protein J [Microcystaceae cyanobacterium]
MLNTLLNWILKIRSFPNRSRSSRGFTLMELLIAASMTLAIVGVAGWALVTIMKTNKIAKAKSEMQYDYNRAVEFIAEELKGSKQIYTDSTDLEGEFSTLTNGYLTYKSWMTPIFAFIPDETASAHIVYYLVDTEASGAPGENWASRYVLYRWGPSYTGEGKYSTESDGSFQHPSKWGANALVDLVLETWEEIPADRRLCRRRTDEAPQFWRRYPSDDDDVLGFFLCVPTAGNLAGKHAEIHALGQIQAEGGNNAYLGQNDLVYEVVTEAFLRSAVSADYVFADNGFIVVPSSAPPGGETTSLTPSSECTGSNCPDIVIENIQGDCTAVLESDQSDLGGETISSGGTGSFTDISESFNIAGVGGACDGVNSTMDSDHYKAATSGDYLGDIVSDEADITHLKGILGSLVTPDGKIDLEPNQWLMFFEEDPNAVVNESSAELNDGLMDDMILKVTATNN